MIIIGAPSDFASEKRLYEINLKFSKIPLGIKN